MNPRPLLDAELEILHEILEGFGDKRAMNLEQLDGFLTAVLCGPDDVPQSEYLREISGLDVANQDVFTSQPLLKQFVELVKRHRDAISYTLQSGDVFTPLLLEDEEGVSLGNDWANGFLRGMELRRPGWGPLLQDDENGGSLVPIFALAHEHDPDPEMRSYKEPVSAELREDLLVGIAAGATRIYRYFKKRRFTAGDAVRDITAYRRTAPKVGRNDPCPCGSGKKFKQCCGSVTLH